MHKKPFQNALVFDYEKVYYTYYIVIIQEVWFMTEIEKRDAGMMFQASSFLKEMFEARDKCKEYSNIPYSEFDKRVEFIKNFFAKTGKNCFVENGFKCNQGSNISVGDNFYCNFNCTIYDSCAVTIGDNVMIGPCVTICTATHPTKACERINDEGNELAFPITIEDNVWIGGGAFINPGVTIGKGAVVASGAVVTKDVPENALVAGVPAVVKKIIDNEAEASAEYKHFDFERM